MNISITVTIIIFAVNYDMEKNSVMVKHSSYIVELLFLIDGTGYWFRYMERRQRSTSSSRETTVWTAVSVEPRPGHGKVSGRVLHYKIVRAL